MRRNRRSLVGDGLRPSVLLSFLGRKKLKPRERRGQALDHLRIVRLQNHQQYISVQLGGQFFVLLDAPAGFKVIELVPVDGGL